MSEILWSLVDTLGHVFYTTGLFVVLAWLTWLTIAIRRK
jgi:hypothetical protein